MCLQLKKPSAVLFATDIAARGLDFPSVDWVRVTPVQSHASRNRIIFSLFGCGVCVDRWCSLIARMIQRRTFTAQAALHGSGIIATLPSLIPAHAACTYDCPWLFPVCVVVFTCCSNEGKALLFLLPSEVKMIPELQASKVPLKQITINPKHATAATARVQAEVAADVELKQLAQKAFKAYVKAICLQPNKDVFVPSELPLDAFAEVGLVLTLLRGVYVCSV